MIYNVLEKNRVLQAEKDRLVEKVENLCDELTDLNKSLEEKDSLIGELSENLK